MTGAASLLVRARKIYTQIHDSEPCCAVAIQDDRIIATGAEFNGLDEYIGSDTRVIDEPDGVVFPAFDDTHSHLMFAASSQFDVPVHLAKDIPSMLDMLRTRASETPPGKWIFTTANWQEYNLVEQRFPSLQELDDVSVDHPILVKRGGHNMVANTFALRLAGITESSKNPAGGVIGRDKDGFLNGVLQDNALAPIFAKVPHPSVEQQLAGIESATKSYAATGIGCVRDCAVFANQMPLLKAALDSGRIHVRLRALIAAIGLSTVAAVEQLLDEIEQWRALDSNEWLKVWGVKFAFDGGIEACATEEPYVGRPDHGCCGPTNFRGTLTWDPEILTEAMDLVLRRGWRIGTHAVGDRAVRILLDIYETLYKRHPDLPTGSLVMEHGCLSNDEQRARAIKLGIPVTVQHPLLHDVAGIQSLYIGQDRQSHIFPVRQWIDEGGDISAGSDYPVGAYGIIHSIWGLTTRHTVLGVLGPEHAITVPEALGLHTVQAAKLHREGASRGRVLPQYLADLTVWSQDLLTSKPDELHDAQLKMTIVGGKIVYLA